MQIQYHRSLDIRNIQIFTSGLFWAVGVAEKKAKIFFFFSDTTVINGTMLMFELRKP